jgi:hypothetical protein
MSNPKNPNDSNRSIANIMQSPSMIDLSISPKNSPRNGVQGVLEKKMERANADNSIQSVFTSNIFGRKKSNSPEAANDQANAQTPAEIIQEVSQKSNSQNTQQFIQCQIKMNDESRQYLDGPFVRQINLAPNELEELLVFIENVEYRRKQQEKAQQERRSCQIAGKIFGQKNGNDFLQSNNIFCNPENELNWVQSLTIVKSEQEREEVSQPLNFFTPQHSWILENWLSQQALSWSVKRYNQGNDQVVYQVSYGFPDQTFLDAEGPSREGAIVAVAEDLMG